MADVPGVLLETVAAAWPVGPPPTVTRRVRCPVGRVDYLAIPHVGHPRWLVPARSPGALAALAAEQSGTRRMAMSALAVAHRRRLTSVVPARRVRVTETDGSLVDVVRAATAPGVDMAVHLGSWSHARSFVVRAFAPDGSTVAFAKVGIDAGGRASVDDEAAALRRIGTMDLPLIETPQTLLRTRWQGLEVLVVSPLLPLTGDSGHALPAAAMLQLANAGPSRAAPLAASGWHDRVRRGIDGVQSDVLRGELSELLARITRPRITLPLGPCHGDWTPWNMVADGERVRLWDWEHCADDVPVGFDHVHFLAQRARVCEGTDPATEARWVDAARQVLRRQLGLDPFTCTIVLGAYLLDVNVRFLRDRAGTAQTHESRSGWGLPLLRRTCADLPG